jgi:hypothetical protein
VTSPSVPPCRPSSRRRPARGLVAVLAIACPALGIQASAASAATVAVVSGELRFVAAVGEKNAPRIAASVQQLEIEDNVGLQPGPGCTSASATRAVCPLAGVRALRLDLGDGDDSFQQLVALPTVAAGGPGDDRFFMPVEDLVDRIDAGPGRDTIMARDGVADQITAGAGVDSLDLDLEDPLPADAENVKKAPLGELPNAEITVSTIRWSDPVQVRVPLHCPDTNANGCRGSLRLFVLSESAGRQRVGPLLGTQPSWTLGPGETRSIVVRLNRLARSLARRPWVLARAVATMPGSSGTKTTIRRIRWIRSRGR